MFHKNGQKKKIYDEYTISILPTCAIPIKKVHWQKGLKSHTSDLGKLSMRTIKRPTNPKATVTKNSTIPTCFDFLKRGVSIKAKNTYKI